MKEAKPGLIGSGPGRPLLKKKEKGGAEAEAECMCWGPPRPLIEAVLLDLSKHRFAFCVPISDPDEERRRPDLGDKAVAVRHISQVAESTAGAASVRGGTWFDAGAAITPLSNGTQLPLIRCFSQQLALAQLIMQ